MKKSFVKYIKFLLITAIVASCISSFVIPVAAKQSGTCGQSLKWTLDAGTLTITGSGAMTDYEEPELSPWYEYREEIIRVVFPDKLTNIGNLAFYGCTNLVSVVLPDAVKRIGHYAFAECASLCILNMGTGVTSIGRAAFYGCESLDYLNLPTSLESIDDQAFYRCESLVAITVPKYVTEFGSAVFSYCKSLVTAEFESSLKIIPEWTFYGCDRLVSLVIPDTINEIDEYAFKGCTDISQVYYTGTTEESENIKNKISKDVPEFNDIGDIIYGEMVNTSITSSKFTVKENTLVLNNILLDRSNDVDVKTVIEVIKSITPFPGDEQVPDGTPVPEITPAPNTITGKYSGEVIIIVKNENDWSAATRQIIDTLKTIKDIYSKEATVDKMAVTVYIQEGSLDQKFLTELTGRNLILYVTTADGSSWKVDCSELKQNTVIYDSNYSYTVKEGSKDNAKKLGTDKCYQLNFNEDAMMDAQVVVKLPSSESKDTNAFLYQVEKDGSYTRLQAVKVGDSGNVNLYLGAVKNNTQYVIGLDVPNERTDDIIIPDEIADKTNNAIARLEKIEYVITGLDSSWGMNMRTVTIILIIVLVGCAVIVGVIMGIMNKRKLKRMNVNYR